MPSLMELKRPRGDWRLLAMKTRESSRLRILTRPADELEFMHHWKTADGPRDFRIAGAEFRVLCLKELELARDESAPCKWCGMPSVRRGPLLVLTVWDYETGRRRVLRMNLRTNFDRFVGPLKEMGQEINSVDVMVTATGRGHFAVARAKGASPGEIPPSERKPFGRKSLVAVLSRQVK